MDFFTHDEETKYSHEQRATLRRHWLKNYVENMNGVETAKDLRMLPDLGFGKPVAVIGAAPIARATFDELAALEITTVCCDKALPGVQRFYRPHFVCALNTQRTKDVKLDEWFTDTDGIGLIVPLTVHPDTVKLWKGEVYWMNPTNIDPDLTARFEQETGIPPWDRGSNVGEFAVAMAGFMRPAEIALFGMWYAWTSREEVFNKENDQENYSVVELVNKGERYWTDISWLHSRASIMGVCKTLYTQGMKIYNSSEGGILYHPEYCKRMKPSEFVDRWKGDI